MSIIYSPHWEIKMKFIATACLIASAFAEPEPKADAALLYGGYTGIGAVGYPYTAAYAGVPYTLGAHYIGKRSADAEPKADPALLYGAYGYAGYAGYPYTYGAYPYTYGAHSYLG